MVSILLGTSTKYREPLTTQEVELEFLVEELSQTSQDLLQTQGMERVFGTEPSPTSQEHLQT